MVPSFARPELCTAARVCVTTLLLGVDENPSWKIIVPLSGLTKFFVMEAESL